jgi:hypothetical protein
MKSYWLSCNRAWPGAARKSSKAYRLSARSWTANSGLDSTKRRKQHTT